MAWDDTVVDARARDRGAGPGEPASVRTDPPPKIDSVHAVTSGAVLAGKYRVSEVIGKGGMGLVVEARHLQLDTRVAIKLLFPEVMSYAEATERFLRGPEQDSDFRVVGRPEPAPADRPTAIHGAVTPGYLAAMGIPKVVDEAICEHPIVETRLAADLGAGAVERRLHRRRRDLVRVHDVRLHEEHDRDGGDDRDRPVDHDADGIGKPSREAVDGVA